MMVQAITEERRYTVKFAAFMLPSYPATSYEDREAKRPIGRDNEAYQKLIEEVRAIAVSCDDAGFDALMMSEHHFHSEGLEASVNPLMLMADLIARTKRIALAPLGMVITTWDPIRLAENVAMMDHLCKGRFYLGVARGYQARWVQTFSQVFGGTPHATSDGSVGDLQNHEAFAEVLKIMKMAWTQETVRYRSELLNYSIPSPFDGIAWPPTEWTKRFGADGELDENDEIQAITVIPKPYQEPHPPLWQPFALSERTLTRCGEMGIMPWIFLSRPDQFRAGAEAYQAAAAKAGRNLALGEDTGTLRFVTLGETQAEADAIGEAYVVPSWNDYFGDGYGYREVLRLPEDEERFPGKIPYEEGSWDRMKRVTSALSGTVDEVKRGIEKIIETANPEWFGWMLAHQQGFQPIDELRRQIDMFGEHIIPEFRD
jgi:alkanesulfonate monooxygenase SsuD/methylene tetrahydromethanopterin reductase-like flavin-dependent oxidoreductase (luciferase family)